MFCRGTVSVGVAKSVLVGARVISCVLVAGGVAGMAMGAGRVVGGTGVVGCSVWAVPVSGGLTWDVGKWFQGGRVGAAWSWFPPGVGRSVVGIGGS